MVYHCHNRGRFRLFTAPFGRGVPIPLLFRPNIGPLVSISHHIKVTIHDFVLMLYVEPPKTDHVEACNKKFYADAVLTITLTSP